MMNIAIIGAGIGGLALGNLLAEQKHQITLYEKFDTPRPLGSGLVIQPVGQAVLSAIGVLDEALSYGNKITRMIGKDTTTNRAVLDVSYDVSDKSQFGLGIHRAALFDLLFQATVKRNNITLCTGSDISEVLDGETEATVIVAEDGTKYHYDLVVDCSGANSKLSTLTADKLDYGAVWGTVDWIDNGQLNRQSLSQCYRQANRMLGILPMGSIPGDQTAKLYR